MGKRQKAKGGQQNLTAQTPSTPVTSSSIVSTIPDVQDIHSDTVVSPLETPQTSPGTITAVELPGTESSTPKQKHHQQVDLEEKLLSPGITVDDISSKEIVAVANVFSNMKKALVSVTNAFDRLGGQIETLETQSLDTKAAGQLRQLQSALSKQIERHKEEVESLRTILQSKIKEAVEEKIRTQLYDVIRNSVREQVEEKVRHQLTLQIPEDLRQQVISHKRQILQVKTSLHNSEARRYNALQTVPGPNARLRPLLRPLPTPEQSPVILISHFDSVANSTLATPTSAFPNNFNYKVPAPTPIKRVTSSSLRSTLISDTVPPTPSSLFPRDLSALFALSQEDTRKLLREYGLDSAVSSPVRPRPRGLSIVNEEDTVSSEEKDGGEEGEEEEDSDAHAQDMNKFMAHIGVPFLMIPAPREKHEHTAPMSAKSRRKLLTPLIIK